MIIKSFIRTKSFKIYLAIITLLLLVIMLLNLGIQHLTTVSNYEYQKKSLLYYMSEKDKYDELIKNKNLINIQEVLTLTNDENNINLSDLFEVELSNTIFVYGDEINKYNLKDNEIVIKFSHNGYENNKPYFDDYIGEEVKFTNDIEKVKLLIKKIDQADRGHIVVSKNMFNILKEKTNFYSYTAKFESEKKANDYYSNNEKNDDIILCLDDESNHEYQERMKQNLMVVKLSAVISIMVFVVVIIVVNRNIISDIKKNMELEKKLGFYNWKIKLNLLKRLFSLHFMSYLQALTLSIILIFIVNNFINIKINKTFFGNNLLFVLIIFISDLLLCLIVNNKSNAIERRK